MTYLEKLASLSLGKRLSRDSGLASRIIENLSGKSRGSQLRVASISTEAAKMNTDQGKADLRRLLRHEVDGLQDLSMRNPIKRASYFKGKEGAGKVVISKDLVNRLNPNDTERITKVVKGKAEEASVAHDKLLSSDGKSYGDASKLFSFKSFSKKPLHFEHMTTKGNGNIVSKAIQDGSMSNNSNAAQFMHQSNMPSTGGFYAYPGRSPSYSAKFHDLVSGKIPANKVNFGRETNGLSYEFGDKLMPEMFIKNKNSGFIDRKSIQIKK